MDDQKDMTMEPKIYAALAKAQGKMKNAPLNKVNPHFRSKYADLAAIRDATVPVLAEFGLSLTQFTRVAGDTLVLVTQLSHEGGEFLQGEYPLPVQVDQPQKMGSALTYARRYGWSAMCGIAADEDDDANAASNGNGDPTTTKNPPGITKFRTEAREFYRELYACTDYDQYVAFVKSAPAKAFMEKARKDFPNDWEGDGGDVAGIRKDMESFCERLKSTPIAAE